MCYAAPLYTIPPWSTLLFNNKPFSSLVLCLALFKLSPFCTNPFVSAKLFHMLLACPIYSTPTICSQQLLNEFFLPGNCSMPKSESHSLAQQLYRTTHRTNAENYSTLYRCLHSNYMSSYYLNLNGDLSRTTVWYPYQIWFIGMIIAPTVCVGCMLK